MIARYTEIARISYGDSVAALADLDTAVGALTANPSQTALDAARTAWIRSREPYLQTEVYRFYGGPIDDDDGPESRINSWPLDENYIDYVVADTGAGIVNTGIVNLKSDYPTIDAPLISGLNEKGGEKTISAGFHAIEFLLWGQDFSDTGPGNRPFTDYQVGGPAPVENQDRRAVYLNVATELLKADVKSVLDQWQPSQNNYRASFEALPVKDALRNILLGMGSLSGAELSGERMQVAYDTKEQEDEHSCFSDQTKHDLYYDALGIQNAYLGRYGGVDGPGLDELVRPRDAALDDKMKAQLQASVDAVTSIPQPFDQAIKGDNSAPGRQRVKAAIDALLAQTQTIVEIATLLGVELNLEH